MGEPMNLRGIKEDKDMKRLLAILSTVAALVACTNLDQPEPVDPADSRLIPVTFKVTKGDELLTKALSLDENASPHELHVTWNEGEEVLVYFYDIRLGTLYAAASDDNTTTLSGWIDTGLWDDERKKTENGGPLYFYYRTVPTHYDGQDGTLAKIATDYDFCVRAVIPKGGYTMTVDADEGKLIVNGVDYANNEIPSLQFGSNLQSIVRFRLLDESNNPINASSFTISAKKEGNYTLVKNWTPYLSTEFTYFDDYTGPMTITPAETAYSTNGDGILFASLRINTGSEDLSSDILLSATAGEKTYYYQKSSVTFEPGKYYEITVKMKQELAISLTNATSNDVGKVIGANGYIYTNVSAAEAAGTTAVALLAYVGSNTGESIYPNGLAISLHDWGKKKYMNSGSTQRGGYSGSENFPVDGGLKYNVPSSNNSYPAFWAARFMYPDPVPFGCSEWFLATGYQWKQMITAMGGYAAFRDAFSGVGGTNLANDNYWTSTMNGLNTAWRVNFSGTTNLWLSELCGNENYVRPVFAFYCEHPQGLQLESVTTNSIGKVIGQNGLVYDSASHASAAGTTAVAMITYVGQDTGESEYDYTLGLAVALNDCTSSEPNNTLQYCTNNSYANSTLVEYTATPTFPSESGIQYMWGHWTGSDFDTNWPSFSAANALTNVPGCSRWFIASGYQWQQMISSMESAGNDMKTAFEGVGGTNMQGLYWLSTMSSTGNAWTVSFDDNVSWGQDEVTQAKKVRPILAFFCEQHKDLFMPLGKPLDQVDQSSLGKLIGADGLMYDSISDAEESGTTAVAMIAFVGENTGESAYNFTRGLAIALNDAKLTTTNKFTMNYYGYSGSYENGTLVPDERDDEAENPVFPEESGIQYMDAHHTESSFSTKWPAFYAAYNYTDSIVQGCSMWFIGTGYQWLQMMTAMSEAGKNLFSEFDERGIGSMPEGRYWLSTMSESKKAWYYNTEEEVWNIDSIYKSTPSNRVRPIIAF